MMSGERRHLLRRLRRILSPADTSEQQRHACGNGHLVHGQISFRVEQVVSPIVPANFDPDTQGETPWGSSAVSFLTKLAAVYFGAFVAGRRA
jgi:hypothetical protein